MLYVYNIGLESVGDVFPQLHLCVWIDDKNPIFMCVCVCVRVCLELKNTFFRLHLYYKVYKVFI